MRHMQPQSNIFNIIQKSDMLYYPSHIINISENANCSCGLNRVSNIIIVIIILYFIDLGLLDAVLFTNNTLVRDMQMRGNYGVMFIYYWNDKNDVNEEYLQQRYFI